ncbi:glycoside hydrolase family 2 [Flavihumibacter sp. UBA7668]|uniref:glycoside hydrolase family 2 n=1 Tax=Flavihumibacter sp. UBA7668 TaxID=1946542 RepID=UPI0025BA91C5|nr:glycoside hydrolase family 2 [Flavihumibacter sp. UBA7668]
MKFGWLLVFLFVGVAYSFAQKTSPEKLSLSGEWNVELDIPNSSLQRIHLPGTLDDAGIGQALDLTPKLDISTLGHLTRKAEYVGKAKYTRRVSIPKNWGSKKIKLILERVLWKSWVEIDGKKISQTGESLVAAHEYDLSGKLIAGHTHELSIIVDNSNIFPGINIYAKQYASEQSSEMTHAYTNHTQIKWNGILGEIALVAERAQRIDNVVISADLKKKVLEVEVALESINASDRLNAYVTDLKTGKNWPVKTAKLAAATRQVNLKIPFADHVVYWDEFNPQRYELVTVLQSAIGKDTTRTAFGIRSFEAKNAALYLNNQQIFVRGNLECVIFPLTGYPPMDIPSWELLFEKAKSYGLNTFRFHSWCPPSAAFTAADKVGFYLQVELPHWNLKVGEDTSAFNFLKREAHRIIKSYGNHPSFLFMSMGNELEGDFTALSSLVNELKQKDKRHLYTTTTFSFQKGVTGIPQVGDEYFVTQWTKNGWVRGQGIFNDKLPSFTDDFRTASKEIAIPLISHEIGQYAVFPDINEISRYKGNLVPVNLISIREDMKKKGMLPLAPLFLQASGKLAALLYKEEIERAMKTPQFDGFQLLQLQDFPGQGTALVGILNAFWESKGFITAAEFKQFSGALVPLIRFPKATYSNNEIFSASIELSNFFKPLKEQQFYWKIMDDDNIVMADSIFTVADVGVGNVLPIGRIEAGLGTIKKASRLTVEVGIKGTAYRNTWPIWVYPADLTVTEGAVLVTFSKTEALAALKNGSKVLLCPPPDTLEGIQGKFVPVFWSPVHFPDQPGTMGLLIKDQHPALADFPTDSYTNWQWWDLVTKSKALIVNEIQDEAIIVRPIDNFVRNQNLASLLELKMGNGKLLICSFDIQQSISERLTANQLKYSLLEYMNSSSFKPSVELNPEFLNTLFK